MGSFFLLYLAMLRFFLTFAVKPASLFKVNRRKNLSDVHTRASKLDKLHTARQNTITPLTAPHPPIEGRVISEHLFLTSICLKLPFLSVAVRWV